MEDKKVKYKVLKKIVGYVPIVKNGDMKFYRRGAIEKAIIKKNELHIRIIVVDIQTDKIITVDSIITQKQVIEFIFKELELKQFIGQKVKVFFDFAYQLLGIEFLK